MAVFVGWQTVCLWSGVQESRASSSEPLSKSLASTELPHPGRRRILYIDCDAAQRGFDASRIAWLHEIHGEDLDLVTATPGECGVELARSCHPDLILLELGLSRISGVGAVTRLRESRETYLIPIVGLSSTDCENVPGLSMYCRRPINAPEFLAMLRVLLGLTPVESTGGAPPMTVSRLASGRGRTRSNRCLAGTRPLHYTE
jgi:CheY-like chemotaxis protein